MKNTIIAAFFAAATQVNGAVSFQTVGERLLIENFDPQFAFYTFDTQSSVNTTFDEVEFVLPARAELGYIFEVATLINGEFILGVSSIYTSYIGVSDFSDSSFVQSGSDWVLTPGVGLQQPNPYGDTRFYEFLRLHAGEDMRLGFRMHSNDVGLFENSTILMRGVPEPSSSLLLISGVGWLFCRRRRV